MSQEVKTSSAKQAKPSAKDAQNFLAGVKQEFKKISWTEKEELKAYTKIVVIGTFVFGLGIYAIDVVIRYLLSVLGFLFQLISG